MRSQNTLFFVMYMPFYISTSGISFHIIEAYETNLECAQNKIYYYFDLFPYVKLSNWLKLTCTLEDYERELDGNGYHETSNWCHSFSQPTVRTGLHRGRNYPRKRSKFIVVCSLRTVRLFQLRVFETKNTLN